MRTTKIVCVYKTKTRIYTAVWSYRSGVTKKWRKI